MPKIFFTSLLFLILTCCFVQQVFAYNSPGKPTGYVNDFAGIISDSVEQELEQKLTAFEQTESNEIAVVTIPSLEDDYIEHYAVKLFEEWGIGKAKEDNGVLLLIAPNEREVRIEVGYGLEGALTDLESAGIIRDILIPAFKSNDYDGGVNGAVDAVLIATTGEYIPQTNPTSGSLGKLENYVWLIWILIFGVFEFFSLILKKMSKSKAIWPGGLVGAVIGGLLGLFASVFAAVVTFAIIGLIFGLGIDYLLSHNKTVNKWINRPRRSGGFWGGFGGGGSGGGFGGFGGGGSGGGGASGRW